MGVKKICNLSNLNDGKWSWFLFSFCDRRRHIIIMSEYYYNCHHWGVYRQMFIYASFVSYFPQEAMKAAQVLPNDLCSLCLLAGRDHLSGWTGDTREVPAEFCCSGSRLNQIRSISPLLNSCLVPCSSDLFVLWLAQFPIPIRVRVSRKSICGHFRTRNRV